MANPEHLRILKQGAEFWNDWRKENNHISPNIIGADLNGANLDNVDLSQVNLDRVVLHHASLINANLHHASLYHTKAHDVIAIGANLSSQIYSSDFRKANLNSANMRGADIIGARFDHANLVGADLRQARLHETRLSLADIINADLSECDISSSDFSDANLSGASLVRAKLMRANFTAANLNETDLSHAEMWGVTFGNDDLSKTIGLENVVHQGPSTIGIDTIYRSKGGIPEAFLRQAGVPDTFITFSKSLVGKAIDFYSCFISFTESDDTFSERLYNDLQAAGVRCWRWKEDAKWGRTLIRSIDEAVHVYDKLVVICSEASLNSPAVIREIERALQKEGDLARQGKEDEVLFPIRLDDYVLNDWNHYLKADVTNKNVGDFRQWKEPEFYRKSLDRLIRDLKSRERSRRI